MAIPKSMKELATNSAYRSLQPSPSEFGDTSGGQMTHTADPLIGAMIDSAPTSPEHGALAYVEKESSGFDPSRP